jgi:multidrug efflux system outer membrane protein
MHRVKVITPLLATVLLAGCTVGPKYSRPQVAAPPSWTTQGPWQPATPKDTIPKGAWWQVFADPQLNQFEDQLLASNQSLEAARDRLQQARSLARVTTAAYFPQLNTNPSAQRERASANRAVLGATAPSEPITQNIFEIPFSVNYEVDVFGRVRRNLEAANASLQSTAADLQNAQLVLTAELAADYFTLRELDAELVVVQQALDYQQKALDLVQRRHEGGVASGLELAQQETVLDSSKTQISLLQQQRAQYLHALAVLTGHPASTFDIAAEPLHSSPPPVPVGVPSDVLERRPDVASAERSMAFQNAQVGIATTAFYPHITLGGSGGVQSRDIGSLISAPSAFWAVGTDLLQPIFNGGRNRANLAAAKSAYQEAEANYRQSVLLAFQQVEDGLSGLESLSRAAATQQATVEDARRALNIANNRYTGGVTTYLDVITAQTTLLSNERLSTQLLGQQMVMSVYLVKALGGGWDASDIRNEQVRPKLVQAVQQ